MHDDVDAGVGDRLQRRLRAPRATRARHGCGGRLVEGGWTAARARTHPIEVGVWSSYDEEG